MLQGGEPLDRLADQELSARLASHTVVARATPADKRRIVRLLAGGPSSVAELAALLPISRPAVSQHLKLLRDAGLVVVRPQGTRRIYQVDPEGLAALRAELDGFWGSALTNFVTLTEQHSKETGP